MNQPDESTPNADALTYAYDPSPADDEPWQQVVVGTPVYDAQGRQVAVVSRIIEHSDGPREFLIGTWE
jgi:hypothetical protein